MNKAQFRKVLSEYLAMLDANVGYYTLNHLTDGDMEMTTDLFHELAREHGSDDESIRHIYKKIFDRLEKRIMDLLQDNKMDKNQGDSMLKHFHKWNSKDSRGDDVHVIEISIVYPEKKKGVVKGVKSDKV